MLFSTMESQILCLPPLSYKYHNCCLLPLHRQLHFHLPPAKSVQSPMNLPEYRLPAVPSFPFWLLHLYIHYNKLKVYIYYIFCSRFYFYFIQFTYLISISIILNHSPNFISYINAFSVYPFPSCAISLFSTIVSYTFLQPKFS